MKILVINPGSTSTKLAIFEDSREVWKQSVFHPAEALSRFQHINEQYDYRLQLVEEEIVAAGYTQGFDAIIGRGGLLKPTAGGVYQIDGRIKHDLWHATMQHASNLAGLIADTLAQRYGCPAYLADPVVTDELEDVARVTGLPEIERKSIFHALNSRAVARGYAKSIGRKYNEMQLIVVHLGGGISVSAHRMGRVIDVNNALNGEGPFSPERAGTLPAAQLVDLCFSGRYSQAELHKLLAGKGGLLAHLGNTHVGEILASIDNGDTHAKRILDAMIYGIAKQVGAMHAALCGETDAILFTGGIAYNTPINEGIKRYVGRLAPVVVIPGEDEMGALAQNALGALTGELPLQTYLP